MASSGASRRRAPRGALHLSPSRTARGTLRHRRARGDDGRARGRGRGGPGARSSARRATADLEALPTFFECATAIAFELFRRAVGRDRGRRSRAGRPARRHQRRNADGRRHHVDRLRSPGAARERPWNRSRARRPASSSRGSRSSSDRWPPGAHAVIEDGLSRARCSTGRAHEPVRVSADAPARRTVPARHDR